MHAYQLANRRVTWWLAAILGSVVVLFAAPALSHAETTSSLNPNNYECSGYVSPGLSEPPSTEEQVRYSFVCSGPITGYQLQLQSKQQVTGFDAAPLVTTLSGTPVATDTFSCSGEFPGHAVNCVGSTANGFEIITGQFAIGTKLCAEPRIDPQLTIADAYLEKGVATQAISGPFDLGRPHWCPAPRPKKKHHKPSAHASKQK